VVEDATNIHTLLMDVILTDDMVHSYLILICSIIRGVGSSKWLMRKLNQWDETQKTIIFYGK
jgi:hypothetical protein